MSIEIDLSSNQMDRVRVVYNGDERWSTDIQALRLAEALQTAFQAWNAHMKRGKETVEPLATSCEPPVGA